MHKEEAVFDICEDNVSTPTSPKAIQLIETSPSSTEEVKQSIPVKTAAQSNEPEEVLKDPNGPTLHFYDHFLIFKCFGFWTWIFIILGILGSMGNGVVALIFQFIFGDLINIFQPVNGVMPSATIMRNAISDVCLKFTGVAIGSMASSFVSQFFNGWASERIGISLRQAYFNELTRQEVAFFDIKKTGALTIALSEDVGKIQEAWTRKISGVMQHTSTILIGLILAFVSSWQMTLVTISTTPLMILIGVVMGKLTEKISFKSGETIAKSASKATEVVSSFKTGKLKFQYLF